MSEGWLLAGAEESQPWSKPDHHAGGACATELSNAEAVAPARGKGTGAAAGSEMAALWRNDAACRSTSPDLFFPVGATGIALVEIAAAKFVCSQCPVREPCLEFALTTNQEYGVWGGFSEEERRVLRRRRRQASSRAASVPSAGAPGDAS